VVKRGDSSNGAISYGAAEKGISRKSIDISGHYPQNANIVKIVFPVSLIRKKFSRSLMKSPAHPGNSEIIEK
jgi:hypothetical protein